MTFDEILDVVSDNDEVLYQEKRNIIYAKKLNFRTINAFLINSQKKLWIPRRHPNKKLFPLYLDCSVGGHVSAGEGYDSAFKRETREELNIDIDKVHYKKIAYLTPLENGTSSFMWVYLIYSDIEPNYNQDDFIEHYWLTSNELLECLEKGDKGKSDLPIIAKKIKDGS